MDLELGKSVNVSLDSSGVIGFVDAGVAVGGNQIAFKFDNSFPTIPVVGNTVGLLLKGKVYNVVDYNFVLPNTTFTYTITPQYIDNAGVQVQDGAVLSSSSFVTTPLTLSFPPSNSLNVYLLPNNIWSTTPPLSLGHGLAPVNPCARITTQPDGSVVIDLFPPASSSCDSGVSAAPQRLAICGRPSVANELLLVEGGGESSRKGKEHKHKHERECEHELEHEHEHERECEHEQKQHH